MTQLILIISLPSNCNFLTYFCWFEVKMLSLLSSLCMPQKKKNDSPTTLTWSVPQWGVPASLSSQIKGSAWMILLLCLHNWFPITDIGVYYLSPYLDFCMGKRQLYIEFCFCVILYTSSKQMLCDHSEFNNTLCPLMNRMELKHIFSQPLTEINLTNTH